MTSTTTKLVIVLIIGLIVGAAPAYYYGTTVAPSDGVTTVTNTTTKTVTGGTTTVTQTTTATQTITQTVTATPEKTTLVMQGFGGTYETWFKESGILSTFEEMNNVEIIYDTKRTEEVLPIIRASRDNPEYDVVLLNDFRLIETFEEGLTLDLTEEDLPVMSNIHPQALSPDGQPAWGLFYMTLAYNTEKVSANDAPKAWADLWDPIFVNSFGLSPPPSQFGNELLLFAAEINGGGFDNIDPGVEMMVQLKPNINVVSPSIFPVYAALVSGEVSVTTFDQGNFLLFQRTGAPIEANRPTEGAYVNALAYTVVAGLPPERDAMAKKLVNYLLSEGPQLQMAIGIGLMPVNTNVQLPSELEPWLGAEVFDSLRNWDIRAYNDKLDEWTEKVTQALAD